ncbi:MAG TPA: pitrilysin family protein [Chthoniobacteraceae bacterium]|nr:pitrilysin family protein [Chthoniobacteraceae bacterium]
MNHSHSPLTSSARPITFPATDAQTFTLPNGLGIIVQEDHSAPVTSVQVWIETGSIHEDQHLGAGLSHLLEHMLFKGTKTRGASEFAQRVQDAGGYINAYTSFDRTVYWIDIPSRGTSTALELLSDAVMNSTLPPEEYVKEQEVIRREFAMGNDDPDRVSGQALFATAYREHPYRFPVIGHLDVFDAMQRDEVMAYYRRRYVPNNMFFVVTGDIDPAAVHTQLAEIFAPYPRRSLPPVLMPQEPPQLARRESHIEFATELTRLNLAWHVPGLTHPDIPALDVLAMVLGHGRSARLYKRLREDAALVHSVDAWCYAPGQPGLFGIDAVLDAEHRSAAQDQMLAMVAEIAESGITPAELEKAKKASLSHQLGAVTTMRGKASDLGSNWILTRNLDFSRDYLAAIQRVTVADIARVTGRYCTDQNLTVTSLNPPGTLSTVRVEQSAVRAGEVRRTEIANGLRLLVREDARLPLVTLVASVKAGLLSETAENNGITRLLSKVLLKGTTHRTAEQLADEIEAVGGSISSDAGNNSINVFVKVMEPDLRLGLEILADVLLHASLPEKAIAREKEVQLAGIKAEEEELTVVARNLLRARLFAGHPYGLRHLGEVESVKRLTRDDLQRFRDRHLVARNCVIGVFGKVHSEEVQALVEEVLGGMVSGEPALVTVPQPVPLQSSVEVEELKDKQQAVLMTGFQAADLFSPDRPALELLDEACSDLGSRFFLRIREEMGLAYFVGSSQMAGLAPGPFVFYCGTDPAKVADVQAALQDEIRKLAEGGLTAAELARAREKYLGAQDIRNQSNDSFAFTCALDELYGLGFDHHETMRREIEAVTIEEVRRVARKYFAEQPSITAIVRPPAA